MTDRRALRIAVDVSIALCLSVVVPHRVMGEIVVEVGSVEAAPGAVVAVPVVLHTDGEPVIGFQSDMLLEPAIIPLGDGWRAACTQNAQLLPGDLGVGTSRLELVCSHGGACIRATARLSVEVFPPGSARVYDCAVQVAPDAAAGTYPVRCANFEATNRDGTALPGRCADGAIVVAGDPVEVTPTIVVPTPTPAPGGEGPAVLAVADLIGAPGDRLVLELRLRSGEVPIAGLQADLDVPQVARVAARASGRPDCAFGTEPSFAGYSSLIFTPPFCAGDDCAGLRMRLITTTLEPIPDGTLLLSCAVDVAADAAPGGYPFILADLLASTGEGVAQPLDGAPGALVISDPEAALDPTPTPTSTPSPRPNPAQGGQRETGAANAAAASGCAIAPASSGRWELLAIAALLAMRRRLARRRPPN